jgi:hypothetical protein
VAHDTPDAPAVYRKNSDTFVLTVGNVDPDATHVDFYLQQTYDCFGAPVTESEELALHATVADTYELTGLPPGTTHNIRVKAWSAGDVSAFSTHVGKSLPRLFVFGHVSPSAVGTTGCKVDIGFLPAPGRIFPDGYIGDGWTDRAFDPVPITSGGVPTARMVIQIETMPSPKIRDGDRVAMVITKDLGGGQERWTPILTNALVREDSPDILPGGDDDMTMFPTGMWATGHWATGMFA